MAAIEGMGSEPERKECDPVTRSVTSSAPGALDL
jgi:hypothetical protein